MKTCKVCFVSLFAYHYFNPGANNEIGGAELQLYTMATELAKDEHYDVSFIMGDFDQPLVEIREGVKLYKLMLPRSIAYVRTVVEYASLWKLLKKIDADIYVQRAAGMITGVISLFCKAHGKQFIYMVAHDQDVSGTKPSWMPGGIVGLIDWKLFQVGLLTATQVVVQHERQMKALRNRHRVEGCIRPSAHRIVSLSNDVQRDIILWIARCERWKQPEIFIEMAKKYPWEKFVMICPAANDLAYFKTVNAVADGISNIEFIDFVPYHKVYDYFRRSKLFVNTSVSEGFPNTFVQASMCGTPILSLAVNPDGIFDKHRIGVYCENDAVKLRGEVGHLLTNSLLWTELSINARAYALKYHDIRIIIEFDKEMFRQCIK